MGGDGTTEHVNKLNILPGFCFTACVPIITWLCSRVMWFQSRPTNWPLLTIESPVAQVVRASD